MDVVTSVIAIVALIILFVFVRRRGSGEKGGPPDATRHFRQSVRSDRLFPHGSVAGRVPARASRASRPCLRP